MARRESAPFSITINPPSGDPLWRQAFTTALEWGEIPNTANSSVNPAPPLPTEPDNLYRQGPKAKLENWGGLAKRGNQLISRGGGHHDYAGNEIDSIDLDDDWPSWVNEKPHSAPEDIGWQDRRNADGDAAATHTYYNQFWNPVLEEYIEVTLASAWGDPSTNHPYLERMPWATKQWLPIEDCPEVPGSTGADSGVGRCQDPDTGNIYWVDLVTNRLRRLNVADNTFDNIGDASVSGGYSIYAPMCFDRTRQRIVKGKHFGEGGNWATIDKATGAATLRTITGYTAFTANTGFLFHDEVDDRYILVCSDMKLVEIDPDTFEAALISVTGSVPNSAPQGLFSKCHPCYDGIAVVPRNADNISFIRLR